MFKQFTKSLFDISWARQKVLSRVCETHIPRDLVLLGYYLGIVVILYWFSGKPIGPSSRASKLGPIVCRLWHWKPETINITSRTSLTPNISLIISYKLKVIYKAVDLRQLQRLYFVSFSRENLMTVKFYETLNRGKSNCMPCIRSLKKKEWTDEYKKGNIYILPN